MGRGQYQRSSGTSWYVGCWDSGLQDPPRAWGCVLVVSRSLSSRVRQDTCHCTAQLRASQTLRMMEALWLGSAGVRREGPRRHKAREGVAGGGARPGEASFGHAPGTASKGNRVPLKFGPVALWGRHEGFL